MKKIVTAILALSILLSMTACGKSPSDGSTASDSGAATVGSSEAAQPPKEEAPAQVIPKYRSLNTLCKTSMKRKKI